LNFTSIICEASIDNFNTEIKIYPDGTAKILNSFILDSENFSDTDIISLPIIEPVKIIVSDEEYELKYATLNNSILIKPRKKSKNYEIKFQYFTTALTSKDKDIWIINYSLSCFKAINLSEAKQTGIIIMLPEKSTLISIPKNWLVYIDSGHLNIGIKLYLNKDCNNNIIVKYKLNSVDLRDFENKKKYIVYIVLGVLTITILTIFSKHIYNKKIIEISSGKKDIIKTLSDREAKIIEFLLQNKNKSVFQSKIYKEFGGSKATLSRDIKKLEMQKRIIKTEAIGNAKKISLTKWFLEK